MIAKKAEQLLTEARETDQGTAAAVLFNGHDFTQTLIAVCGAEELPKHESSGETTLYVVFGALNLVLENDTLGLEKGVLVEVPAGEHAIQATEDCAFLITGSK